MSGLPHASQNQSVAAGNIGSPGAVLSLQFGQDARNVVLDGAFSNIQLPGDVAIGSTLRQQHQHFSFTLREGIER